MMSDFFTHWGHAAVRVSILLTVGTLVVGLCIRCARRKINPAGQSLLWLCVLALGLCWFTLPMDRPDWWPAWSPAVTTSDDARPFDAEALSVVERDGRLTHSDDAANHASTGGPWDAAGPFEDSQHIGSFPDAWPEDQRFPNEAESSAMSASGEILPTAITQGERQRPGTSSITQSLFTIWIIAIAGVIALFTYQHWSLLRRLRPLCPAAE